MKLFTCDSYDKLHKLVSKQKELKSIVDEIEKLNKEKYFGALYNVEEENERWKRTYQQIGLEEGLEQGIEQGIEQGRIKKTKEVIEKLLKKGMSKEEISEIVDLSIEEIDEL